MAASDDASDSLRMYTCRPAETRMTLEHDDLTIGAHHADDIKAPLRVPRQIFSQSKALPGQINIQAPLLTHSRFPYQPTSFVLNLF
jgi:hypothetical protein